MKAPAFFLLTLLLSLYPSILFAQEGGLAFLRIGTNAEASAMGDAMVATSDDAFSTYWNAAGLAAASSNSAALSHHIWIANARTYSMAGRFAAGTRGGFGLFLTAMDSGNLEARIGPGDPDGVFDAQFVSTGLSYGHSFGNLRLGATVKYLSERIFINSANGYGFDFGLQYEMIQQSVHIGVALQNVGEMSELSAQATELPRTLRAGLVVYPFRVLAGLDGTVLLNARISGEVSHVLPTDVTRLHFGVGAEVVELVEVRAGFVTNDALRGFSLGGGLESNGFQFDYAFVPFDGGFGGPGHVLSLIYLW